MLQFKTMKNIICALFSGLLLLITQNTEAQEDKTSKNIYNRYDSLRGSLNPARSCYDVYFYDLHIKVEPAKKYISGSNTIYFIAVNDFDSLQIDLFSNMKVQEIVYKNHSLKFRRDSNHIFIYFPQKIKQNSKEDILVKYEGKPMEAKKAPWDGGFTWKKDSLGKDWIGVACQGTGASLWWPCKDHLSDEPDSIYISCSVPQNLQCISNGRLISENLQADGFKEFKWKVTYPINTYNVTLNIAEYAHFSDTTLSGRKPLTLDYYVLPYNLEKAKKQFKQVKGMLKCYEKYFGPYPFHNDGYKLVETPYYGMEHQSAIAYGNNYKNTSHGLPFDFIIIHESGHEWFGNSLSCTDEAEMWLHESFTTYAEALYVECTFGYKKMLQYLQDQKKLIKNMEPMIGIKGINDFHRNDNDIYYKGSWMLHTLRNVIDNDSLFFSIIKTYTLKYKNKPVTTEDFIHHVNILTNKNFQPFFDQYLTKASLPHFEYKITNINGKTAVLNYRLIADVDNFEMPLSVTVSKNKTIKLIPKNGTWQTQKLINYVPADFKIRTDLFLVDVKEIK